MTTSPNMFTNCFVISTYILFLSIFPFSNSINADYTVCSSPYFCGKIQSIGYPFWGGNTPKFCGRFEFQLDCMNGSDYPCMYVGTSTEAKVLNINTSTHKMIFVSDQYFNMQTPSCLSPDINKSLEFMSKNFKLSSEVNNIRLFFGCPSSVTLYNQSKWFTCSYKNGTKGSAYYFGNELDGINDSKLCEGSYDVPVFKKELDELMKNEGNKSLLGVLQKGFEMDYVANFTACSSCQKSGGICGSSNTDDGEFVCFCRHGSSPLECSKSGTNKILIELSVALVMGIGMLVSILVFLKKRKSSLHLIWPFCNGKMKNHENVENFLKNYGSVAPKRYTYSDIRRMTNNFKDKLGQGGFGSVYKGMLNDGRVVAVKLLAKLKSDGDEFMNEVASIGRTNHVNIVTLLGFCYQGEKRALVYEFMSNGSLEKFIYNGNNDGQLLPWKTLFNICTGIARGLDYLHRGCTTRILHFDIKPHNILLDDKFHPKISDFGLARLCPQKESFISMLEARGTIGYIAPEIFCRSLGGASHKSDVYSYGMMVLEMVGAKKKILKDVQNSNGSSFPLWINDALELANDVSLHDGITNDEEKEIKRKMVVVSLWCIQTNPSSRPSINRVVEMLEGSVDSLPIPSMPRLSSPPRSINSVEVPLNSDVKPDSTELSISFSRSY